MPKYDKQGREILDDTPVEVPVRFQNRPLTTVEEAMRALSLASMIAQRDGHESFEESLDFGEDEDELTGSSEFTEMDEQELLDFMRAGEEELARRKALEKEKKPPEEEKKEKKVADSDTKAT